MIKIIRASAELGISKIRITGGEPLVRLGIADFVRMISRIHGIEEITMTTNGVNLAKYAFELKKAGLNRVNVSLDTLKPERFRKITRGIGSAGDVANVLEGIQAAKDAGLNPVKINVVVMDGVNDDEILDFARKTIDQEWHVRFIELMPFTGHDGRTPQGISTANLKQLINPLGHMEPYKHKWGNGPAKYYKLPGANGTIGFISALSEHICFSCNRIRLTSDGKLRPCLMSEKMIDLRILCVEENLQIRSRR
jgi:cyclic pyranopterin phosphate synthase